MSNQPTRQVPTPVARLPLAVYLLAFNLFAMGSAEFLVAGVLPALAEGFGITLSAAGAVISTFAIGVVMGATPGCHEPALAAAGHTGDHASCLRRVSGDWSPL